MQVLVLALVLILPLSALLARRMTWRIVLRYAATWIAIFLIGWIIVANFT